MAHQVLISPAANRQLSRLPRQEQARLIPKINALGDNPRPAGVVKMKGEENVYRIRVGDYRILYEIQDINLIVFVFKIGNRREVYR